MAADAAARRLGIDSAIADARQLDLPDESVDAVLLLGPIYHLPPRDDRVPRWRRRRVGAAGRAGVRGGHLALGPAAPW